MSGVKEKFFCEDLPTRFIPGMGDILVSGASGYIGGRLVPELAARGYRVRALVRADPSSFQSRWPQVRVVCADALDMVGLREKLKGIHTAYYLIHSMLLGEKRFEKADILAAENFRAAAMEQGVSRIIYLGGLGDIGSPLSPHLRSRMQVADTLQQGGVPVTVLRAAIIIGSGSASFEIVKNLVKNLPVLPIPRWAKTQCQPISIRDVIKYLVGVLELDETLGKSYDIGGEEILTYEEMLRVLADILGKRRIFIPFLFSSRKLYAYMASLFTPVPMQITMCLMGGCRNEVVCQNHEIVRVIPFERLSYKEALVRAISQEEQDRIHTRWSDAYPPAHELALKLSELRVSPRYTSSYRLSTTKERSALFDSICRIGGKQGWFNSNWLWRLRGLLDKILTGVGTARGRRSHRELRINDVIDFWRVEDLKVNEMLLLRAEMKLPGKAWLRFDIEPGTAGNFLSVSGYFLTSSLAGKLYWYLFLPFHRFIFYDLITQIERRS